MNPNAMGTLTPELCDTARWMADELETQRLRVVLVSDWYHPDGVRRLRAVDEQNPGWYRAFCAAHPANRQRARRRQLPDTAIKRRHTLRALRELASGRCQSEYARRLLPWVQDELERVELERAFYHQPLAYDARPMLSLALLELL